MTGRNHSAVYSMASTAIPLLIAMGVAASHREVGRSIFVRIERIDCGQCPAGKNVRGVSGTTGFGIGVAAVARLRVFGRRLDHRLPRHPDSPNVNDGVADAPTRAIRHGSFHVGG